MGYETNHTKFNRALDEALALTHAEDQSRFRQTDVVNLRDALRRERAEHAVTRAAMEKMASERDALIERTNRATRLIKGLRDQLAQQTERADALAQLVNRGYRNERT